MKVAILGSRGIPAHYGGFEIFAEKLALGLVGSGHEVRVFCPADQEFRHRKYRGIRLEFIPHSKRVWGSLLFDAASLLRASRQDNDVIVMLGYASSPFFLIPKFYGTKLVVNLDGLEWARSKWTGFARLWLRWTESLAVRLAPGLVSDSRAIAKYYLRRYGIHTDYIAYGTEMFSELKTGILESLGLQASSYYLSVMRMEPENGVLEIVQGFIQAKTDRPLVLVGSVTPYFESRILPLLDQVADRIHFVGPIYDRERLFELRQNAYAYFHGHSVGGTNPSLLDSMSASNVIVARDVEYNHEVLEDCGFYFDGADSLADAVHRIESSPPEVLVALGTSAKSRVVQNYRWEQVVGDYLALFSRLIAGKVQSESGAPIRTK